MLIYLVIYAVLVIPPFWILLPRHGIPSFAAIMAIFPILAVGLLWLMAFSDRLNLKGK